MVSWDSSSRGRVSGGMVVMARTGKARWIPLDSGGIRAILRLVNELIDAGDPRAKVVGKRRPPVATVDDAVAAFDRLQRQMTRLWVTLPFPTGVHRFKDWEEFETWKTHQMMRNSPARR